ncbi:MAG: hypothetical protein ACFCU6_09100 [Balneolaceae bacterium]
MIYNSLIKSLIPFTLFLILLFNVAPAIHAQDEDAVYLDSQELRDFQLTGVSRVQQKTNIKGSPFFNEEFIEGYILIRKNVRSGILPLRLNIDNNHLQYMDSDGNTFFLDSSRIKGFNLKTSSNDEIQFKNGFESDDFDKNTLVQVIYEGRITLLAHHVTTLHEGLQSYGSATKLNEYVNSTIYYISESDNNFKKIRLRERDFRRSLDKELYNSLSLIAEKHNLKYNNDRDIAQMFRLLEDGENL